LAGAAVLAEATLIVTPRGLEVSAVLAFLALDSATGGRTFWVRDCSQAPLDGEEESGPEVVERCGRFSVGE
jgi:hypothetical protein